MNFPNRFFLYIIFVVLFHFTSVCAVTRVYFSKCAISGFTCQTNSNKKIDITYECPNGRDDVQIFINQFSAPSNAESLTIKNCKTFTIATRCSGDNRPIQKLHVLNINHMSFQRLQYEPMLPPTVIFENISYIDVIPTNTFGQIDKAYHTIGCYVQSVDFQNIYFKNVKINTIESNAFVGMNQFKNFSFLNVHIKRIQTSGIRLKHDFLGSFEMRNCVVDVVESLGIQSYGRRSLYSDNHFTEIASNGINGTMEDFYFTKNFVETLQPHAFSILATNIFILDNNFLHIKSSALEKLSPGLLRNSAMSFGRLKFMYDFSKNSLNFLDAGSLHPDYVSYENVQTEMMFSRNKFLCSCENLGWMFSALGHGSNSSQLEPFYEMVMDEAYKNTCDKTDGITCELPVKSVREMIGCGKCLKNVTLNILCNKMNGSNEETTDLLSFNISEEAPEELLNSTNYSISSNGIFAASSGKFYVIYLMIVIYFA